MIVPLDAGRYLSLDVSAGGKAPKPWQAVIELCGPDDEVIERRQGKARSPLEARTLAVRVAGELRRQFQAAAAGLVRDAGRYARRG